MSQEVQGMLIQLEATTAQLRREMATADSVVGRTTKKIDGNLSKVDGAFDRVNVSADKAVRGAVSSLRGLVAPIAAAASAMAALRKGIDVQREFDRLNAGLITATGSSEKASVAFQALREFAQKTPYDLGQAVEGFTKLVNLGLTPSEKALMSYGNTASSMGKDLNQMIEAVADAATGEFERLKEFGIKASKQGDQVSLTFQGVTKSIGNNAAEIEKYLIGLGENQFAGAMALRMQSLDGAIANLGDTWDQTFQLINDAGAGELMRSSVVMAVEALEELNAMLASGQLEGYLDAIGGKFEGWGKDIESTLNVLGDLFDSLFTEMGESAQSELSMLTDAFENFPENVRAFIQLMTVEVLAGFETAAAYAASFKDKVKAVFTDDTFGDVSSRLAAELNRINGVRDSSIASIVGERDAAVGSYSAQIAAAEARRKKYEEESAARKADSSDRLAQFKVQTEGQTAVAGASDKATAAVKKQISAIDALIAKYDPATKAQKDYDAGMALADAQYKANKLSAEQYQKVVQGLYADLNKPIWAQHNNQADEAAKRIKAVDDAVQGVLDRLDPATAAARKYAAEQKSITDAMREHPERADEYRGALEKLRAEYDDNQRAASQWGQFTERALDSVDQSFADAWKNIDQGFSGFADSLKDAFKNLLAELAHMAITKPIIMQIGAAMGIGGGTQGNNGIWGSLLGGGSGGGGGFNPGQLLQYAQTGYSLMTGVGPAALAGYQSGGIMGGLQGAAGYYGNLASSAWGTVSGWFGGSAAAGAGSAAGTGFGLGQSVVSGQIGNAAYAGAQAGAGSAGGTLSSITSMAAPIAAAYAAFQAYGAYKDGVRLDPKDTRGNAASWVTGFQPLAELNGLVSKITDKLGIGGALGNILNIPSTITAQIGSALFGGGWETKNYGLAFSVANGDFLGQSYEYQKKKGGLFSSNKKRTNYTDLDPETAATLQAAYDATESTVADLFAELSLSVEEGSLAGLQIARQQISTKGKTEEEIQQAIAEWFGSAADAMTAELNKVFDTGLDYDLAGMQAFVGNLLGVNETLRYLDVEMFDASVSGGKLAESLAAAAGGLEALAANSATYYSAFFTEAEKTADQIDAITRTFEGAEVTLAGSRAEYRAMVEDIDLTTEAGREMFATMMALSGQAATYYSIVEQQAAQATAAANAALFGAVDTAYAALQRSIAAQQQEIQQAASATTSNINALTGVSNSLDAALKRLRGTSDETVKSLRAQAVMTLNSALVQARSGQSLAGFDGLQDALDTASQMDTALYGSLEQFEREQGRTANLIAELEKVNGKQLTAEEELLKQYEEQLSKLDQQLAFAQAQLDALNGIDKSVKSVEAAVAAMNASVVAALSGMADGLASKNTTANNSALIDSVYKSVLGRETDDAGKAFWQQQLASGNLDYDQLAKAIAHDASKNANDPGAGAAADYLKNQGGLSVQDQVEAAYRATLGRSADAAGESYWMGQVSSGMSVADLIAAIERDAKVNGEIPGFAAGGFHSGGLRLVGENGPELEVTGPSRIYNASQTAAMLGGAGSTEELRALRGEVAGLRSALSAIAKYTESTAYGVRQMNEIGLPQEEAA